MLMTNLEDKSCYDVIGELDNGLMDILNPDQRYFVLGGIATSAIMDPTSVFDHQTQTLIAGPDTVLPVIRQENGTRRDIDVLVLDLLSKKEAKTISRKVDEVINRELIVSVFGLKKHHSLEGQPLAQLRQSIASPISKRTIDEEGRLRYELFPLSQEVPQDSFEPWTLQMPNGQSVSIFNPAAHMLAYKTRSITGIRYKDQKKVSEMEDVILAEPEFKDQIYSGNLSTWQQFADDIQAISKITEMTDVPLRWGITNTDMKVARKKAEILRDWESNEIIIKFAQRGLLQQLTKPFTGSS